MKSLLVRLIPPLKSILKKQQNRILNIMFYGSKLKIQTTTKNTWVMR